MAAPVTSPKPTAGALKPGAVKATVVTKEAPAPKAPPFRIEPITTKAYYLKFLVYAGYGIGKTFLAGTSADVAAMNDVLMISAESGDLTLQDNPDHAFDKIDTIRVMDYKVLGKVYEFLKLHCEARDANNVEKMRELEAILKGVDISEITEPKRYRTVIVDSLSEVETYCLNQLLGIKETTRLDEETASAEWAEYKKNNDMVRRMVRQFRDLPMHVIFTCASAYTQDEQKRSTWSPALTGKLSNQVQGFMDVVGYLITLDRDDKGNVPRRLWVQPAGRFAAKCRFSKFKGTHFDNPTIKSILDAVGLTQTLKSEAPPTGVNETEGEHISDLPSGA